MIPALGILIFHLDEHRYGLPIEQVDRVVASVALAPLPQAPEIVLGVFSERGTITPTIDLRRRLGRPPRDLAVSDNLIIAHAGPQRVALLVDAVEGLQDIDPATVVPAAAVLPHLAHVRGIASLPGGLVLIQDLHGLLSLDEVAALQDAVALSPPLAC